MSILNLDGYTDLPDGKIAVIVTFLDMERPAALPSLSAAAILERWHAPDPEAYRALYRSIGEDWLWFSRLLLSDRALGDLLGEPTRQVHVPRLNGAAVGVLELDFQDEENVELAFFGLVRDAIGKGIGRWLMAEALRLAWSRPQTRRLWVHTCTGDSPAALGFYRSFGFRPYRRAIEVVDDPRLAGILPKGAAPHVPVIEPRD